MQKAAASRSQPADDQARAPLLVLSGQDVYRERRLLRWLCSFWQWGFAPVLLAPGKPAIRPATQFLSPLIARQIPLIPSALHWLFLTQARTAGGAIQFLQQNIEVGIRLLTLKVFRKWRVPLFVADPGLLPIVAMTRNILPIIAIDFPDWVSGVAHPRTRAIWAWIENTLPQIPVRITVSEPLRQILARRWYTSSKTNAQKKTGVDVVVPNMPMKKEFPDSEWFVSVRRSLWQRSARGQATLLYFSGFSEGARGLKLLVQALHRFKTPLRLYIGGQRTPAVMKWLAQVPNRHSVRHVGWVTPVRLPSFLRMGVIGLTLLDNLPNHWVSLSGKFFDYVHACLPQVVIGYPAYRRYLKQFRVGIAIAPDPDQLADAILTLLSSWQVYEEHLDQTIRARHHWTWENHTTPLANLLRQFIHQAM